MPPRDLFYGAWISMPALALVGLGVAGGRSRKRLALRLCTGLLLLLLVALELACGGNSTPKSPGTLPGTYTVNVVANAGAVQHTIPVSVNVN
jgi:lipopolysaccharide export LptBFGC system permease protein LptF